MTGGALIVGASHAGVQLAVSLRAHGYTGAVTIVGAEPRAPYQRPPLSKGYLVGAVDPAALELRTRSFYATRGIEVVTGERITGVQLAAGDAGSGVAHTDQGRRLDFDHLGLTVGARPRRLEVPGAELDGVCYLRVVADADRLRDRLRSAQHVVVVGGGFIGLEAASVARSQGKDVTVVEAAERLIPRAVAPIVSEFYRRAHVHRGAHVRVGTEVVAVDGEHGQVTAVRLGDGTRLRADVVIVGVGIVPRTELAEGLGLLCDGGIVVDEFARTSRPSIVAAGDCTLMPDPMGGGRRVRLESMPGAVNQARCAAATLAGRSVPHTEVPWFWSDQYDLKLQIAGVAQDYDQCVVRGDPEQERFSVLYYRQGRLLAINSVNQTSDYVAVRQALTAGLVLPPEQASRTDISLKELLLSRAPDRSSTSAVASAEPSGTGGTRTRTSRRPGVAP